MNWTENIQRWQTMTAEARECIRWERIPRQVALSMAFEHEPVELSWLQRLHLQAAPPVSSKRPSGSSQAQLAPLLAERVLHVERDLASGAFAEQSRFPHFILELHQRIAGNLCPDWAGRWRTTDVRVGEHHPPPPHRVPVLMRDYGEDLRVRLDNASGHRDDLLLETLAFAEGRLLSIHPFTDFNDRVTRLFLRQILRRMELPPVDLVPTDAPGETAYRGALQAGDALDWRPLMRVWQQRFEQFMEKPE